MCCCAQLAQCVPVGRKPAPEICTGATVYAFDCKPQQNGLGARRTCARQTDAARPGARVEHGRELGVTLARWVSRRPVGCARHAIRQSGEDALLPDVVSEEQRPVTAQNTPPIPTVHMSPARNGKWHLLLHLELSAVAIGKIVSGLEEAAAERRAPASPPPPLKRLEPSPSALNATPLRPGVGR